MRVLLSTIGSRGDVQPLVALALQLRALGQEVRLCVPPDFRDWIDSLGIPFTPIGPELRRATASSPPATPAHPRPSEGVCRHPIRDNHGGSARLGHDRGSNSYRSRVLHCRQRRGRAAVCSPIAPSRSRARSIGCDDSGPAGRRLGAGHDERPWPHAARTGRLRTLLRTAG